MTLPVKYLVFAHRGILED